MRVQAVMLALVLPLSGCVTPPGPAPVERPADWDEGEELVFISGFRAHSADEDRQIVPMEDSTLAAPAYCGAYQNGVRQVADTCSVISPYSPQYWDHDHPWGIEASWDGRGDDLVEQEQDESMRTVVAFDAAGVPVAYWDTAAHPEAAMAIE